MSSGLLLDTHSFGFVSVYFWSQKVRRLAPTSPSLAGWPGGCGEETPLGSCLGGGLAGRTAAAAGSGWTCWPSQERSDPPPSRVLCCRLCLTSQEKKKLWKEVALHPPLSAWPADPAGAAREEHLLLLRIATTSGLIITNAGTYIRVWVCLCICGLRRCADSMTPFYLASFGWLAGGVRGRGTRAAALLFLSSPSAAALVEAQLSGWKDYCCGWLWLDEKRSAPPPSRVLCCRLCLTSRKKEKKQAWKEVTGNCFVRLSPTSGQARRRRRRGAQLDGEFTFYASRRRLRARPGLGPGGGGRTGSLLSTPPAVDFGSGLEGGQGAAAGRVAGSRHFLLCLCRRLLAWPGGGGGGARSWTGSLPSTPLAADFEPRPRPEGAVEGGI